MLAKIFSAAVVGLSAVPVEVEVDIASQGLPNFFIVGLPDKAVEEAKERVRSALKNSGADFPAKRITVNLAPADLPKEGPSYDLPIAIGILLASGQVTGDFSDTLFMGELSLDGRLRHTNGALLHAQLVKQAGMKHIFLPQMNAKEAALIHDISVYPVPTLLTLLNHLTQTVPLASQAPIALETYVQQTKIENDMKDIQGQEQAKRALEIAAAGGHNILFKGPPGAGKTLLARSLPSILPTLSFEEMIEVTKIYSISGLLDKESLITIRPFRAPHHTTSHVGLIGGGSNPKPGEISLAHRGVLFLDELPEFPRTVLEALRQPLEDGFVSISRAQGRVTFPVHCMLIAAQNPCPCGYLGDPTHTCTCTPGTILRYQKKISGPLLDRIDIHLDIPAVRIDKLTQTDFAAEDSATIRQRVQKARDVQTKRFLGTGIYSNAEMSTKDIKKYCKFSEDCLQLLKMAVEKLQLSARSYYRIIKLSRTIADLAESEEIKQEHITESLQYRMKATN